ncbi:hypothetical protein TVAG_098730 [Trichomonas vaginalis G3]|uniref:Uncharacterized protein n=1 Tax=Trichomonas vaginalis (strain ATCC PRA-98 / G3) TaxID=412133 RepID=A2EMC4_TRIV3|nr:hypothetical protein TVAGG3_0099830 [Trichomonas vaginalis G3]EAY06162.1 hypothetical protein TVAG_098730 [Trichomonas vaginalis G3]KAI5544312.1 hypothetical protein TVAGG3_0099830 [Trichomonas vaginalis G3]|eukprot:XP_001318385.1 hypothetical protein [Trichomonas vaginalis G3]
MVVILADIIETYIPGGLPSKEKIEMMSQEERNELSRLQSQIIIHFRRAVQAELDQLSVTARKLERCLNGEIKAIKPKQRNSFDSINEYLRDINVTIQKIEHYVRSK